MTGADSPTLTIVAYDEHLAERIRALLAEEGSVAEQPMFGGLSFLVAGHLAVAASTWGGILVRVGADAAAELERSTNATRPEMGSRTMKAWLHVEADDIVTDQDLRTWVGRGLDFVAELPPK